MKQTPMLTKNNDHVVNELQRDEYSNPVTMTVTEVVRWLSQKSDLLDKEDITPERRGAEEGLSVRTDGDKECADNDDTATEADENTDWYEVALREEITVTSRSGGNAQSRLFVRYASIMTKPAIFEYSVLPVTSPAIC